MGGHVDRFFVRLVLALTVVSWASVLAHDAMEPEPAETVAAAASAPERAPAVVTPPVAPPTNGTTTPREPPTAAGLTASA